MVLEHIHPANRLNQGRSEPEAEKSRHDGESPQQCCGGASEGLKDFSQIDRGDSVGVDKIQCFLVDRLFQTCLGSLAFELSAELANVLGVEIEIDAAEDAEIDLSIAKIL